MGRPRSRLPILLSIGLAAALLATGMAGPIRREEPSMTPRSHAPRVAFAGPRTTPSGLKAAMEISDGGPEQEAWPWLSVSILGPNGDRLWRSPRYAAWFSVALCWDDRERLWIASADVGIDVIAFTPDGWRRHRRLSDAGIGTMLDAETGERLPVVDWPLPDPIRDRRTPAAP